MKGTPGQVHGDGAAVWGREDTDPFYTHTHTHTHPCLYNSRARALIAQVCKPRAGTDGRHPGL